MKSISIKVSIDKDVSYPIDSFIEELERVLNDERGWKKFGYSFVVINSTLSSQTPPQSKSKKSKSSKLLVRLSQNATIAKQCYFDPKTPLSCYDPNPDVPEVLINFYRFMEGSVESKLSLQDYKTYVINHEIGHALGRGHSTCPCVGCLAPVMMQQTLGIGECSPQPWPLHNE